MSATMACVPTAYCRPLPDAPMRANGPHDLVKSSLVLHRPPRSLVAASRAPPADFVTRPRTNERSRIPVRGREPLSTTPRVLAAVVLQEQPSPHGLPPSPMALIPAKRQELSNLDFHIASLTRQRVLLEAQISQLVRQLPDAPIQRLPHELLSSIFLAGLLDTDEDESPPLMISTIMLVCRTWRDVALDTPDLWSRIVVNGLSTSRAVRRRLIRSKTVPLHVSFDFDPRVDRPGPTTQTIVEAMDILRPSIHRWRTFRLLVPERTQAHAALVRCAEAAPQLEHLTVHVYRSMQDGSRPDMPTPLFGGTAPRLRACVFSAFDFRWDVRCVSRLRLLRLGGYWNDMAPSARLVLNVLRECPELEELALHDMLDVDSDVCLRDFDSDGELTRELPPLSPHAVQLPRLTRLSLYSAGYVRTRLVLSQLCLPALENAELCDVGNVNPVLTLLYVQSMSSLPLRHLRIEASSFCEARLIKLLGRLPSLSTLELIDADDALSTLIKSLSRPDVAQSWVCPRLQSLCLKGCQSVAWRPLQELVESRLPANCRSYPRRSATGAPSSASIPSASPSAPLMGQVRSYSAPPCDLVAFGWPRRLQSIDLTGCHQIGKDMTQWLRMYVDEVKCDKPRASWQPE